MKSFYKKISSIIPDQSRKNLRLFIGYVNDRPISTAGVFITDVAGIYDISTHPEMQNKGYGSAMFYTALKFALDNGLKEIVLQASEDGLGIYKRFGFEEICEFNVWSNKDKL
ncbi:GNAT family N-acetyltransferase [Rickettsia endosymbiont of Cardiosporidium cionae]|uniref:GNAT family N-acetyltransferase n=1 Tax=Rickettsia endosymbiont of Cardiosporidium cionae TaxID=2777155 RepID=UPI0018931B0C|nr:GNAT family N-acetyltransferase [Rickettsia endosymbiont of Cardiosporidium cionae]KAF8818619.1 GNAT family N-acetyltransferase [Rickettsia endosymbiont of Cardiosporidium cionae]